MFRRVRPKKGQKGKNVASGKTFSLNRKTKPIWDLYKDGVTFSYLSRFCICPERFRLHAIEGWSETGLKDALEFGNAFHHCLEQYAKGIPIPKILKYLRTYQNERINLNKFTPPQRVEFEQLMGMVQVTFPGYVKHWEAFYRERSVNRLDPTRRATHQEEKFSVPIEVPSVGKRILLRGKIDGIFRHPKTKKLWIIEHKTKSNIDEEGLQSSLSQDLQTMLYATVAEKMFGEKVEGVLYDVIRRCQLKPRKGDFLKNYLQRIDEDIDKRPDWYFVRWETELEKNDLHYWQQKTLFPLLIRLVRWWESIRNSPFTPWNLPNGSINPEHYQQPFGVYDGQANGRRGEFFEMLTRNSSYGYKQRSDPFPELV